MHLFPRTALNHLFGGSFELVGVEIGESSIVHFIFIVGGDVGLGLDVFGLQFLNEEIHFVKGLLLILKT
jgi:hypothetical protein